MTDRSSYTGRANARQYAAGRRWADRWRRWPAHTDEQRIQDFNIAERSIEDERNRHS